MAGETDAKEARMRQAFNLFDTHGEGYISKDALKNVFKTLGREEFGEDANVTGLFTDRGGKIDFETFKELYDANIKGKEEVRGPPAPLRGSASPLAPDHPDAHFRLHSHSLSASPTHRSSTCKMRSGCSTRMGMGTSARWSCNSYAKSGARTSRSRRLTKWCPRR